MPETARWTLQRLQQVIKATYGAKDQRRGVEGTFMWLVEEVGELSSALRSGSKEELSAEFADVLRTGVWAWGSEQLPVEERDRPWRDIRPVTRWPADEEGEVDHWTDAPWTRTPAQPTSRAADNPPLAGHGEAAAAPAGSAP